METETPTTQKRPYHWQWLLIALIIAISFSCVFFSTQAALLEEPERVIAANILAGSRANYNLEPGDQVVFAPLNRGIIFEATHDAKGLQQTVTLSRESITPAGIVKFPPTPTRTPQATQVKTSPTWTAQPTETTPASTDTPVPNTKTPLPPTDTALPPTPTKTRIPPTKTPPPTPTQRPPNPTATGTHTSTPISTETPSPSATPTPTRQSLEI